MGFHFPLWAGTLAKGKIANIYSSSKYAFRVAHNFGMLWKQGVSVAEKKPILTPCWNYFFDLLFVAFVIIITQNGLPQRILPFCLTVKLQCLCSEPSLPVYRRKVMGLDLDTAKHFSGSLSPLPSSTSHLPSLSLASLSSTTVWIFPTGREKTIAASTHSLHTPLYFQPKTKLSFLQHQFQGRVPIGSPKVT